MDAQIQNAMSNVTALNTGASAASGKLGLGSGSSEGAAADKGGFLIALQSVLTAAPGETAATPSSFSVTDLLQVLNTLLPTIDNAPSMEQADMKQLLNDLQALSALMDDQKDDTAQDMMNNDALQQLLAQMQAFLQVLPAFQPDSEVTVEEPLIDEADSSFTGEDAADLDESLFIPLFAQSSTADQGDAHQQEEQHRSFTVKEAKELIAVFKAIVPFAADQPEVGKIAHQLHQLTSDTNLTRQADTRSAAPIAEISVVQAQTNVPLTADLKDAGKAVQQSHLLATENKPSQQTDTSAAAPVAEISVVKAPVKSKLEILAAKALIPEPLYQQAQTLDLNAMDNKQDDGLIDWDPQTMHVQDLLKMTDPQDDTVKVPSQPVPVHRFASELSDFVVKNMRITLANGLSEAKISLAPEHLGHVDVKITVHNGQVVAQFMADSAAGKEMLESQIVQLRANLQNQGVQVERIEVTQSSSMQSAMFQDSRQQSQQQSNQSGKGKSGTNQTGFEGSLDDSEQEAVRRAAANSSFDVTA